MKIDYKHLGYWLGDQKSLELLVDAEGQINGKMFDGDDEESWTRLLSVADGVATITVKGSLTSKDSPWNQYFGITSYNEIRNAIVTAIEDPEVNRILLDIDSGGGDAKGVAELSDFIQLARQRKPIDSYVSGSAFSAAYWIASATDTISGPKMSEAGSIGVIAMIPDYSKYYEEQKIKIHVFRGGKYKALGNGYEELTVAAQNIIQGKIDKMEGFFLDAVSENRNIPRDRVKEQVGEGLTFFADEAVNNGLMDNVLAFDELYSRLVKSDNSSAGRMTLSEDGMKKILTPAAVAAQAAGASTEEVSALMVDAAEVTAEQKTSAAELMAKDSALSEEDALAQVLAASASEESASASEESGDEPTAEQKTSAAALMAKDSALSEEAALAQVLAASASEETPNTAADSSLVAHLKAELTELRAEMNTLTTANVSLTTRVESAEAAESTLKPIVSTFIEQMCMPLGLSVETSTLDSANLAAQYTKIRAKFTETFKVGASAEVTDGEQESAVAGELSPAEQASVRANKI